MRRHVVRALARRDLRRYFNNPTGYIFITLFIFLSGAAAFWNPAFFLDNLATFDQLNAVFPYLIVPFIAALTMGAWSEERKQGTDELLLTLPASSRELVLGKYAAVVGIYTVAVLLSLSHAAVLRWLGRPDPGLLFANYLGYWLVGASLAAAGLLASMLTANAAVAFVLGALFCGVPVLLDAAVGTFADAAGRRAAIFGVFDHFNDFARGMVTLSGLVYFGGFAALCLYAAIARLRQDDWPRTGTRLPMAAHYALRVVSLVLAFAAVVVIVGRADVRLDATAEKLRSLGPETRRLLAGLPPDRPVHVQVFVSPDVPAEYVQQRDSLLGTLREIQAIAGSKVDVLVQETEPYSPAAHTARERFGIVPRLVSDPASARTDLQNVFLGIAFTAGSEEQVIPFFENGLSAEYELVRAIRVVARTTRKRLGVIDTDAKVFGGVDFESGRTRLPWAIVTELRRQYETVSITPYEPITEQVDALLVVLPSTMLQRELDHVFDVIRAGVPALLVVDPVPAMDMRLSPAAPMAERMNPYASPGQMTTRKNTGDIQKAMASVGVNWPPTRVAWDSYRPHPEMAQLPREVVFVGSGSGNPSAFSPTHPATAGLQELVMMYAGYLEPAGGLESGTSFEALLQTGQLSGTASYFQLVQPSPSGPVLNVNLPHQPENKVLTLAAQATSARSRVIAIADLDFVSDQFFELRARGAMAATPVDNVTFFLNCIDVLANDDAFIALRKRRVRHRTLERVEAQTRAFIERRSREEQQAAADAQTALDNAQNGLKKKVEEIEQRPDVDAQAKQIMARNLEETETRRLNVLRVNIEQAKNAKIQASRETMEAGVRRIQSTIRTTAVLLPPLPMLALGTFIFVRRRQREVAGQSIGRLRE